MIKRETFKALLQQISTIDIGMTALSEVFGMDMAYSWLGDAQTGLIDLFVDDLVEEYKGEAPIGDEAKATIYQILFDYFWHEADAFVYKEERIKDKDFYAKDYMKVQCGGKEEVSVPVTTIDELYDALMLFLEENVTIKITAPDTEE